MKIYEKYEVFEGDSSKVIFEFDTKEDVRSALMQCKQALTKLIQDSKNIDGLLDAEEYAMKAVEALDGLQIDVQDDARCYVSQKAIDEVIDHGSNLHLLDDPADEDLACKKN